MKKSLYFAFFSIFAFFGTVFAETETLNWLVDGQTYTTTTCESGGDIILPTTPSKPGYVFRGWKNAFTPIEYLESTGVQYIDTGFAYNQQISQKNFSITISYDFPVSVIEKYSNQQNKMNLGVLGVCPNVMCFAPYVWGGGEGVWFQQGYSNGNDGRTFYAGLNKDQKQSFTVDINPSRMVSTVSGIYDKQVTMNGIVYSDKNLYIFRSNGSTEPFPFRLYGLSFESDGVLVRDFIPVLDRENVPCLYDKVERKFYYNAGAGSFIAGPVIDAN